MKSISLQQRQNKSVLHAWMNHLLAAKAYLMICAVLLGAVQANGQQRPPELQPVTWVPGASGFLAAPGSVGMLTKNGGGTTAAWNAGAVSSQRILRDGRVVFKVTAASQMTVGLSLVSANESNSEIDFAINVLPTNTAQVYQNGVAGISLGAYTTTTEFSIRRTGSKVEYLKDGIVLNTSTLVSAGDLIVDCSIAKLNSAITSAQIATGDLDNDGMADAWEEDQLPPAHTWADVQNFRPGDNADLDGVSNLVEFQTGTLATDSLSRSVPMNWLRATASQLNTKTDLTANAGGIVKFTLGSATQYDARAFASQAIAEDGQMMFTVTPGTIMTVGFNTSNVMPPITTTIPFPAPDVEWAIITATNGTFFVKPNAANFPTAAVATASSIWTYTADTVFTIQRIGGQMRFLKDGVLIHTAAAASVGPLYPNVWLSSPTAELTMARVDTGDMDNDSLPDVWERQYLRPDSGWNDLLGFTLLGNSDGTVIVNGEPVSTGDTISNADELRDGTSPIDPLSKSESVVWRADLVNAAATSGSTLGGLKKSSTAVDAVYNARAFGTQAILEDGIVVFQVSGNGVMALGLNASNVMPIATSVTPDQEWAFTTTATGTYTVKPNAAVVTPTAALNTYNADTRFMIQRVGGVVRFLRDGVVVHTAAAKSSGTLYVNVWLSTKAQGVSLARVYTGDVDNDRMPDAWELTYLDDNAGLAQLVAFEATGNVAETGVNVRSKYDPDWDGIVNLDEYFDGTNPLVPQLESPVILWKTNPSNYFTLTGTWGGVQKTSSPAVPAVWDADAVALKLDVGNLLVPFVVKQTARLTFTAKPVSTLAMGFTAVDNNRAQTDLEYGIQLIPAASATVPAQASVWEGTGLTTAPVSKFALGTFDANTRFSIRRIAQQIDYLKDGQVLYSSVTPATANLMVDSSFKTKDSEINSARLYTGDVDEDGMPDDWEIYHYRRRNNGSLPNFAQLQAFAPDASSDGDFFTNIEEFYHGTDPLQGLSKPRGIVWGAFTGTSDETPPVAVINKRHGYLYKTGTTTGFNADATSTTSLIGDGTLSFIPSISLTVGFTTVPGPTNTNNSDSDLSYAFLFGADPKSSSYVKVVRPESTADLIVRSGNVYSIRRTGTIIDFLVDGIVVETSTTPTSATLYADCSLSAQNTFINLSFLTSANEDADNDGMPDWWELQNLAAIQPSGSAFVNFTFSQLDQFRGQDMGPDIDGVSNLEEYLNGLSATSADTDRDGMRDRWELDWGLAATDPFNAAADLDSDGLSNLGEFTAGTNPFDPDSDDDEMTDGFEGQYNFAPLDPRDAHADLDGDLVPNLWEFHRGTRPDLASEYPWDAYVDPDYTGTFNHNTKIASNLWEAYAALKSYTHSHQVILMAPGPHTNCSMLSLPTNPKKIAIVAASGADRNNWTEGTVVTFDGPWELDTDHYFIDGLIFDGLKGMQIGSPTETSNCKLRLQNCIFRNCHPQRFPADPSEYYGGAVTNLGCDVSIEHCTFFRSNSYYLDGLASVGISAIANVSGTLNLKNSIVWDDEHPSDMPVTGSNSTVTSSLIQTPGSQGPALMLKGYPTALSSTCFSLGSQTVLARDLQGQSRSLNAPTLGAVEWISMDGDSLPDWWEMWWFSNTLPIDSDITDKHDKMIIPPSNIAITPTVLQQYLAFRKPTRSTDSDDLDDEWEMQYFSNLTQGNDGNEDGDARTNLQEFLEGFDPTKLDEDYDSEPDELWDSWEKKYFTVTALAPPLTTPSPLRYGKNDDPDLDGWLNFEEFASNTNPMQRDLPKDLDIDSNGDGVYDLGDGVPDAWEIGFFSSATLWGATDDPDHDGVNNLAEYLAGTSPLEKPYLFDGNGNRLWDWWEELYFPTFVGILDPDHDEDGDGRSNELEMLEGTDPTKVNAPVTRGPIADFSFNSYNSNYSLINDDVQVRFDMNISELTYGFRKLYVNKASKHDHVIRVSDEEFWQTGFYHYIPIVKRTFYSYSLQAYPPGAEYLYGLDEKHAGNVSFRSRCDYRMRVVSLNQPADRLIVKAFRRVSQLSTEVLYIQPGNTHATGLSGIIYGFGARDLNDQVGEYVNITTKASTQNPDSLDMIGGGARVTEAGQEGLVEIPLPIPRSLPPSDIAGPRYRKIGLNGTPMPDSLPGEQNDQNVLPEETFVDAYSRQLRHSTTDIWAKLGDQSIPFHIRRDAVPEVWSWRSGLRPDERPDRPFGPGWTSNLTPHIKLEVSVNTSPEWHTKFYETTHYGNGTYAPNGSKATQWPYYLFGYERVTLEERVKEKMNNPPRITLTDERGASYSFIDIGDTLSTNGYDLNAKWVAASDERQDAKTIYDTLVQTIPGPAKDALEFRLIRRDGSRCVYLRCGLQQSYPQDRIRPGIMKADNFYFRLVRANTPQGRECYYTYPETGNSLIPQYISTQPGFEANPGYYFTILQDKGRVTAIQGPSQETVYYGYSGGVGQANLTGLLLKQDFMGSGSDNKYPMLVSVSRKDQPQQGPPVVLQEVKYEYAYQFEEDPTPDKTVPGVQTYGHLELAKITDELNHSYEFTYDLNQTTQFDCWNGAFRFTRKQVGIPRLLNKIKRPDESVIHFTGTRNTHLLLTSDTINGIAYPRVTGGIETVVTGPCGSYRYLFSGAKTARPPELTQHMDFFQGNIADGDVNEGVVFLSFTKMDISSAAGTEKYVFNPEAGMALSSVTDLSGNTTTFEYKDLVQAGQGGLMGAKYYDDPTKEISALNGTARNPQNLVPGYIGNHVGIKTFSYDQRFRKRISVTDERGIKTYTPLLPYGSLAAGLPVEEHIIDTNKPTSTTDDVLLRKTIYHYNVFQDANNYGFVFLTRTTVTNEGFTLPLGYSTPPGAPTSPAEPIITEYVPDLHGRIYQEIRYAGPNKTLPMVTTTTYTPGGQKQTVKDARNNTTTFQYDPQTLRLKATHFPDQTSKFLFYDKHGNIIKEVDETGNATLHRYDLFHRREATAIDLNHNGELDANYNSVILPAANSTAPVIYDGDIVSSTTYNAFNLPVMSTDPRGVVTLNEYDPIGRLIRTTVNWKPEVDPLNPPQVTQYNNADPITHVDDNIADDFVGGSVFDTKGFKPLRVTDPRGFVTTFVYNKAYQVLSKTLTDTSYPVGHPAHSVTSHLRYDDVGNTLYQVDPLGRITQTVYDDLNRPIEVIHPSAGNTPAASSKTFYTPAGLVWRTLDEEGAESLTFYDSAGRKTKTYGPPIPVYNPLTAQTESKRPLSLMQYDDVGNLTLVTDPLNRITETQYNSRNRSTHVISSAVANVTDPVAPPVMQQLITETQYDDAGRVKKVIDPMNAVTQTDYDRAGRAYRVIAPPTGAQTHVTRNKMDPGGNILEAINAKDQSVLNVYDAYNRLKKTTDHNQIANQFTYDLAGNKLSVKDGLNQGTAFTYDAQNRLRTQTFNSSLLTFEYNASQKTSQLDLAQRQTNYGYDARDRMLTLTSSDISRTMSYDRVGRLKTVTEAANPQANVSLTYNALGALISETSVGLVHSYFYDIVGSRIHAAYGSGRTVSTEYDSLNRPLVITEGQRTTSYGYDLAGRAVKLQTANGNLCWNVYDVLGRLKKRTLYADATAQTKLTDLDYDYDALGNVMSQLENWPGSSLRPLGWRVTTMTYDDSNRLETETVSQSAAPDSQPGSQLIRTVYSYDAANNRQTKTVLGGDEPGFWDYNYNNANQLRTWQKYDDQGGTLLKNALLFYDNEGNRSSQELSVPGATKKITTYQWDAQNRLMGVTMPDSSQHNYVYDYRTRRIGTRSEGIPPSGGGAATSKTTTILFAGGLSLAEWEQSGTTLQPVASLAPTVEYTRGPDMGGGVGGLLYSLRSGAPKFNLSNGRGDIVAQSDSTGALTWTASYEAYGKRTKETGANADKQRANSKDEDPTGLLNEGFRYRDLETGVWLSRDPAGFVDGPNLYAYVRQNPWTGWDPDGLQSYHWYQGGFMRENFFDAVYNTATTHATNSTKASVAGGLSGIIRGGMDLANMVTTKGIPQTGYNQRLFEGAKKFVSDSSAGLFGVDGNSAAFKDSEVTGEIFSPVPGGAAGKGASVLKALTKVESKAITSSQKASMAAAKKLATSELVDLGSNAGHPAGLATAANRVGITLDNVKIADGVAQASIGFARNLAASDMTTLMSHFAEKGATSAVIDSGFVINERLASTLGRCAEKGKLFKGAEVTKISDDLNQFSLNFKKLKK